MENLEGIKKITREFTLPDYIKPCVALMLQDSFDKGQRDRVAFIIATELRAIGKDEHVAEKILIQWDRKNNPGLGIKTIQNKIESAYNKEYGFGCNREPIIVEYCQRIEKDFCSYYQEILEGKKRIGKDRDFVKYGWPKLLKPAARQIYYIALPELEKRRGIKPGDRIYTSHREIACICGISLGKKTVGRGLEELRDKELITYKPGEPYRWRQTASEIRRIIPIPKPRL